MITPPPTTTISTTSSSSSISSSSSSSDSSIASSRLINFESISSTIEPKSFSFSTSANDYHFRRVTPAKKFKFAQKFRRQPRLKIRKSEEGGPLRGNKTAFGRSPIILPHLAPLNLENDIQQIKLDNDENDFSSNSDTSSNSNDLIESTDNLDPSTNGLLSESGKIETGFRNGKFPTFGQGLVEFDGGRPPPVDFNEPSFGVFGSDNHKQPEDHFSTTDNPNRLSKTTKEIVSTNSPIETTSLMTSSTTTVERLGPPQPAEPILKNSGLLPALPPSDFIGEFGTGRGRIPMQNAITGGVPSMDDSIFTGDSALVPNRFGPTGDGLGPPIPSGAAIPPPVPALGIGGLAAGILPTLSDDFLKTQTAPTTVKPSALLSFLTKADVGLNQAINHFEQGTPVESAAIDILEYVSTVPYTMRHLSLVMNTVCHHHTLTLPQYPSLHISLPSIFTVALGSEKLDSQAKLLGHIDRTIGIDNIQRLQRWANAGGAMDALKEQNYTVPPNLLPTIPPQLEYLFAPGRKKHI
ncbi:hypothetical protein DINM_005946 [Dirofilaria immitis]|nr:hypothetical protein [Dirofilaria immitis]